MPTLADIQHDFIKAFYQQQEEAFIPHICQQKALSAKQRFAIYRSSITECLAKSLRATYATCEQLVGKNFFNGLAYTFIEQTPSRSSDITLYGEEFADFIDNFPPAQQLPYLADVCRLCWHYQLAYRSTDAELFDAPAFAKLSEQQQEKVSLQLPKNTYLLKSSYPIKAIWEFTQQSENASTIDLNQGGVNLLIRRNQQHIVLDELQINEYLLAEKLQQPIALEKLQIELDQHQLDISKLLPKFLERNWLGPFHIGKLS